MALIPWKGKRDSQEGYLSPLDALHHEMDRMFARFFGGFDNLPASFSAWAPSLDVVDSEKEITIRADLPGIDPKEIEVSIAGNTLTIAGERKSEREEKGEDYARSERMFGSFRRSVPLPEGADPEKIAAEYENGVLTVRVGKTKSDARRITINRK